MVLSTAWETCHLPGGSGVALCSYPELHGERHASVSSLTLSQVPSPTCHCFVCLSVCLGHATRHVGSSFPDLGSNPCPLQWKQGVLTTGPPGKSPVIVFIVENKTREFTVAASYLGSAGSTVQEAVVARWECCCLMKYYVWSAFLGALADRSPHDDSEGCVDRLIIARRTQLVSYRVRFKTCRCC